MAIKMNCSICKKRFIWDFDRTTLKDCVDWMEVHLHGESFLDEVVRESKDQILN